VRLNKLLASRGIGARRKCDALIQAGKVRVNGEVVTEPGRAIEPQRDRIEVEGRPLPGPAPARYYMLHKPVGVISTLSDPEGRRSLRDLLPPGPRLFPVGRLDADTSGLLLLTNDGELAHHLMHPRYGVAKRYRVHVDRAPNERELARLQNGVEFEPGIVSSPAQVWLRDSDSGEAVIELALHEGRQRQVRRMCEAVGLTVRRLHRYGYGPLKLGDLTRGLWRELSDEEVAALRAASARPQPRGARGSQFTGRRSFERDRARPRRRFHAGEERRPRFESRSRDERRPRFEGGSRVEGRAKLESRSRDERRPRFESRSRVEGRAKLESRSRGERRPRLGRSGREAGRRPLAPRPARRDGRRPGPLEAPAGGPRRRARGPRQRPFEPRPQRPWRRGDERPSGANPPRPGRRPSAAGPSKRPRRGAPRTAATERPFERFRRRRPTS